MADCDWDPGKDASNRRKHGAWFAVAARYALRHERQRYEQQAR